ncbi:uncharacterized protein NECHADRAFT_90741 [Fusarium vanettenii 77-13-4]|uniref:FAD-binding domain-containing protein n=1 Tax=Fusarium vanettenii (strain ATCC MYA-4622 / CBS 123669 / FGSC 9596 / NRRL 45880 / 77-13-4) TaxID=660122 RepID=C7Z6F5_FUSV7|nr:uncharacterized protein NECHADRAFT_90741 [Fusarium vanettenii 77-13-4]EEU40684.1 hypothetical protein NECHADRAFT_90741 [Fusarium vanettenii 77-13-4]
MADYRDLEVSIIGAGMGGLTAALAFAKKGFKQVHVYENAPALGFVGAGIQIAPNLIRVLDKLGIWGNSSLEKESTNVKEVYIYDGPTNNELARVPMEDIHQKYGYSHYAGHRAALAGNIYDAAKAQPNVHFHFGQTLQSVTSFGPDKVAFVIKGGDGAERVVETDVLIGADGIKSPVRESILNSLNLSAEVEETGTAAYRILVEREKLEPYPELLKLIDSDAVRRWIGSKRHIIAYPIHNHTIYNIATAQPDVNFAGSINATWTNKGDKKAMKEVYSDFCPLVQKLLDLVPDGDVVEWRLRSHKPLDTWTLGGVALLGDACHPTLPHLSQGAAMAIEDAAVLAEAVSLVPGGGADREELTKTLKVYELARKPRTSTLVELAALSARTLHLGEGKAKEERDRQFAAAKTKGAPVPDKWASPEIQKMIFEHECIGDIRDRFQELYASLGQGVDETIAARI